MAPPPTDPAAPADPGPVRLPHTGIHVPHDRFTVRDLHHRLTGSAIAYDATLCLRGEPVGRISNPRGTTTVYRALTDTTACTPADIAAYAHQCRDPHGAPMSVDDVLNALIDESETAATVAELLNEGLTAIRLRRPVGDRHLHHVPTGIRTSAEPHEWAALGRALRSQRPPHDGEVFEIWHADRWHRLPT